jgi:hypothetical protein
MFNVPIEEVPKGLRSRAKAINFGIIYGMKAGGLAKQLGITQREAQLLLQQYHAQYPGIRPYMQSIVSSGSHELKWRKLFLKPPAQQVCPLAAHFRPYRTDAPDMRDCQCGLQSEGGGGVR